MLPIYSLIVPLFKSEENLPSLLEGLEAFQKECNSLFQLECVFVVDGSPDRSGEVLLEKLQQGVSFQSQLHFLSKNFGAPSALRLGLSLATGQYLSNYSADMQEPFDLLKESFLRMQQGDVDICYGERVHRSDPLLSKLFSSTYWFLYRRLVSPEIPKGGLEFFICTSQVRDRLMTLTERNSFLLGMLFWMGFRRTSIPYDRQPRKIGKSAWTFRKRIHYLLDSTFSFSDFPVKFLTAVGLLGILVSVSFASALIYNKLYHNIEVPGYAAIVTAICFFGGIQSLGLGLLGEYLYRTFENTKNRPFAIVRESHRFGKQGQEEGKAGEHVASA